MHRGARVSIFLEETEQIKTNEKCSEAGECLRGRRMFANSVGPTSGNKPYQYAERKRLPPDITSGTHTLTALFWFVLLQCRV